VILYNSGQEDNTTVSVQWSELGWAAADEVFVRDLWQHADVGVVTGGLSRDLPAHDVSMLRLSKDLSKMKK
jgi:hypothetical protein